MWIALYLTTAMVVAFLAWHTSHYFQALDGPTERARATWSMVAGLAWPLALVCGVQLLMGRLVIDRLVRSPAPQALPVPAMASDVVRL